MDDTILETKGLTKEFRGFVAVNGVDLRVKRGEIHALIGPNGAGKTTCFNLLTKFLAPTSGSIKFNGIDITGEQPKQLTLASVEHADVVITMGCGDTCPVFPGKRYEDWHLRDPAGQPIEVVREVRDEIKQRVGALVDELLGNR